MVETKKISQDEIKILSAKTGFNFPILAKDYYVTIILYLLRDIEGIYFKGGTAIQKLILDYSRLSEDVDYTLTRDLEEVKQIIEKTIKECGLFERITKDKDVDEFVRLIVHYKDPFDQEGHVFIDLNQRGKIILEPEKHKIKNYYNLDFEVNTLNIKEMLAEKVCALINRNRPRDYFDVYYLIKRKIPIDLKLVKKKMKIEKQEFNINKIFNKTNKIYSNWTKDLSELTLDRTPFNKIIQTIKEHFNYKK